MKASIIITNEVEGITCTISDTLFWKTSEVIPGSFAGNREVLSSNGETEEDITTSTISPSVHKELNITPSPVSNYLSYSGHLQDQEIRIIDINGYEVEIIKNIDSDEFIDVSHLFIVTSN